MLGIRILFSRLTVLPPLNSNNFLFVLPLNIWKKIIKWALCTNRLLCCFSPISLLLLFTILLLSLWPFTVSHYCCMLLLIVGDDDDDYCCCYVGDVIIVVVIVIVVIIVALCVCNNCWPLSLKLWIDKVK